MKESNDLDKNGDIICLWIGRLDIVNMSPLPTRSIDSIKTPTSYFIHINKIYMKGQKFKNN